MNPNERIFGQGKITTRLFSVLKIGYNYILDFQNYKDYDGSYRLTPDNNLQRFRRGLTNTLSINHAVSNSSYYTLNLSYFFKSYEHYLFEDLNNLADTSTQYVYNTSLQTPPYSFSIGGTNYSRFNRSTGTLGIKLDWQTQVTQQLNIQFGGEYKQHRIYMHDITLIESQLGRKFQVEIPPLTSQRNNEYLHKPTESSVYAQSKLEAFNLILNLGVRLDVFSPDGKTLSDPEDPTITSPLKPANRFYDTNGNGVQDEGEVSKTLRNGFNIGIKMQPLIPG